MAEDDIYGQLTGFAAPLIGFPQILIQSVVVSLVPLVAAAKQKKDVFMLENAADGISDRHDPGNAVCDRTDRFGEHRCCCCCIRHRRQVPFMPAPCLQLLGLGFPALAIVQVSTGALQGMGKQLIPVRNLFLGVVVKFALTWSLTAIPAVNIKGAALGNAAAYTIAACDGCEGTEENYRDSGKYVSRHFGSRHSVLVIMGLSAAFCYGMRYWVDRT